MAERATISGAEYCLTPLIKAEIHSAGVHWSHVFQSQVTMDSIYKIRVCCETHWCQLPEGASQIGWLPQEVGIRLWMQQPALIRQLGVYHGWGLLTRPHSVISYWHPRQPISNCGITTNHISQNTERLLSHPKLEQLERLRSEDNAAA